MSSVREADASPPPHYKTERSPHSFERQPSSHSSQVASAAPGSYQGSSSGQRFASVGLDVLGRFSRRQSAEHGRSGAAATSLKSPTLSHLARQDAQHSRTGSLPSHSSSSSSSSLSFVEKDRDLARPAARRSSLQSGGSSFKRKSVIADSARSQRFTDQVNQTLSPPVSPQEGATAKQGQDTYNRPATTAMESEEEQDTRSLDLDARRIHPDQESESGTARSAKRSSIASLSSGHTANRRSSLHQRYNDDVGEDDDQNVSVSEMSYTSKSSTRERYEQPHYRQEHSPTKRHSASRRHNSGRRQSRFDADEDIPPLPTTPFPSASHRHHNSQGTSSSTNSAGRRQRPPIPSEFGMRPRDEEASHQSPSYLSPRDPPSSSVGRDRAVSPISPTFSTASLSRAGSARLRKHLQQGDADWLPPAPPAAYPQHYQAPSSIRDRERERKRSLLSSGSGGPHSAATSGSGGSGSRDEADRRRSSSSALLRRSESPTSTASSARYSQARHTSRRPLPEEALPPRPGSAAWWNELDDIKAKAKTTPRRSSSLAFRSQSRQSTFDDDDELDETPAGFDRTPATGSVRRRGIHPRAASVMEGPKPNSAPSRLRSTADFHAAAAAGGSGAMPRSRTAMGLNGMSTGPSRPQQSASRGTPTFQPQDTPTTLRRFYEQNNTSSRSLPNTPNSPSRRRPPPKTAGNEHHRLLNQAMDHLERTTGHEETPDYVRTMGILSELTTSLNLELRTLVADLVEAQVEAEMDMESSGLPATAGSESMRKVEKQLARLLRISDEQVRSLTEGMLSLSRREKTRMLDLPVRVQRPESRAMTARRQSIEEDASTARESFDVERFRPRETYDEELDDHEPDESLGSTMTRTRSLGTSAKQHSRRHQSRSETAPAASRNESRRTKDSNGTVKASPSLHYPRHSVASVSGISGATADPGISPTHYTRTRAASLDIDHYDYSYAADESRYDQDEDDTIHVPRSRQQTFSSVGEPSTRSSSIQGAAATALRLGLNSLTGNRRDGRRPRQSNAT